MTNFEKHRGEIESIVAVSGELPAKVNGKLRACKTVTDCKDCEFDESDVGCNLLFIQWAAENDGEYIIKSCEFCKYGDIGTDDYPCIECKERYLNQFEPKPKEPEMKPCPFCGGKAEVVHGFGFDNIVQCEDCFTETRICETPEEAIEVWNKRCETWISRIKEEV